MRISKNSMVWLSSLIACVAGCQTTSRVDDHFGEAVAANTAAMTANPQAGMEANDGVTELEGATVEGTLERYRRAQEETPPDNMPASIVIQGGTRGSRSR